MYRSIQWICWIIMLAIPFNGKSQNISGLLQHKGISFTVQAYYGNFIKEVNGAKHPGIQTSRWVTNIDQSRGATYKGKKYLPSDFNGQLKSYFDAIELISINGKAEFKIGTINQIRTTDFTNFYNLGPGEISYSLLTSIGQNEIMTISSLQISGGQLSGVEKLWKQIDILEEKELLIKKEKEAQEKERQRQEIEKKNREGDFKNGLAKNEEAKQQKSNGIGGGFTNTKNNGNNHNQDNTKQNTTGSSSHSFKSEEAANNNISNTPVSQGVGKDNAGNYYEKFSDGSYKKISREVFEEIQRNKAKEKSEAIAAMQQIKADSLRSIQQSKLQANREREQQMQEITNQKIDGTISSFYAASQVRSASQSLQSKSQLNGNYNSIQELEKEFQQKMRGISSDVDNLIQARNQVMQSSTKMFFSDADAKGQALGQIAALAGTMIGQAAAEREAKLAKEKLIAQRDAEIAKMEQKKKDARKDLRVKFFETFPEGGLPLTQHSTLFERVWFYFYQLNKTELTEEKASIKVSNLFPVDRYNDGSWIFKNQLLEKIFGKSLESSSSYLIGYFADTVAASQARNSLIEGAKSLGINPNFVNVRGLINNTTVSSDKFWGIEKSNNQNSKETTAQKVDEWGNPIINKNTIKKKN